MISTSIQPPALLLSPLAPECLLVGIVAATTSPANAAWPAANRALFLPIVVDTPFTCTIAWWLNGTVSGNVDVGLYDSAGSRLLSTGSTAMAGASDLQSVNIADVSLGRGAYFLAMAVDNGTATFLRFAPVAAGLLSLTGMREMADAFPLPATATLSTVSSAYLPIFGFLLDPLTVI